VQAKIDANIVIVIAIVIVIIIAVVIATVNHAAPPSAALHVPDAAAAVRFCKANPVALFLPAVQTREDENTQPQQGQGEQAKRACGVTCQSRRFRGVELAGRPERCCEHWVPTTRAGAMRTGRPGTHPDWNEALRTRGDVGEALGRMAEGEYDVGDPVAVESIIEPREDVREPVVLDVDMPGRSWRGSADPLAAIEAGEEAAATGEAEPRAEVSPGDFFWGCETGEEVPEDLLRGESLNSEAPPTTLGLVEDDFP
jgi:hypothetical protein